jgi:photosynthetic reaction center cytochrome c subunit
MSRLASILAASAALLLAGCERPPIDSTQIGYRGTGMELVSNPRLTAKTAALHVAPPAQPPVPADGPKAKEVFKNVKVLGELSAGEFTRHMVAITQWVAPEQGCNYCHNPQDLSDDSVYTKVVARRMIQMTQHLNGDWGKHVGQTGVTCYTCHRGNPVPAQTWSAGLPSGKAMFLGDAKAMQNRPAKTVGLASLPYDPFSHYLKGEEAIRVNTKTALPTDNTRNIKDAEHTYALMMHMSGSLGVNCTFCHNTRSFASWEGPPQRVTAYHGIRMVRDVNLAYLEPLADTFPANRKGPAGDVLKISCGTCHQGANKPLNGAKMLKDHPELAALAKVAGGLPPPVNEAMRSILYFAVGSPVLEGEQAKGMAQLIATMSADAATKATISGYHSASGDPAQNAELAKQRAFTVRDSLLAAGIATERVILEKPQEVQGNLAGEDPTARRVEITVAK